LQVHASHSAWFTPPAQHPAAAPSTRPGTGGAFLSQCGGASTGARLRPDVGQWLRGVGERVNLQLAPERDRRQHDGQAADQHGAQRAAGHRRLVFLRAARRPASLPDPQCPGARLTCGVCVDYAESCMQASGGPEPSCVITKHAVWWERTRSSLPCWRALRVLTTLHACRACCRGQGALGRPSPSIAGERMGSMSSPQDGNWVCAALQPPHAGHGNSDVDQGAGAAAHVQADGVEGMVHPVVQLHEQQRDAGRQHAHDHACPGQRRGALKPPGSQAADQA